jgi:hypothetical protein
MIYIHGQHSTQTLSFDILFVHTPKTVILPEQEIYVTYAPQVLNSVLVADSHL